MVRIIGKGACAQPVNQHVSRMARLYETQLAAHSAIFQLLNTWKCCDLQHADQLLSRKFGSLQRVELLNGLKC